jgi:hypothetical protein
MFSGRTIYILGPLKVLGKLGGDEETNSNRDETL